jgi:hypothetical protein
LTAYEITLLPEGLKSIVKWPVKWSYNFFKADLKVIRAGAGGWGEPEKKAKQKILFANIIAKQIAYKGTHSTGPILFLLTACESFCMSLRSLLLSAAWRADEDSLKREDDE